MMDILIFGENNKELTLDLLNNGFNNIYVNFKFESVDHSVFKLTDASIRKSMSDYFEKTKNNKVCIIYSNDLILHNVEKLKKYSNCDKVQLQRRCYTEPTDKLKFSKLCKRHSVE